VYPRLHKSLGVDGSTTSSVIGHMPDIQLHFSASELGKLFSKLSVATQRLTVPLVRLKEHRIQAIF
jgi:hypothetical protein